MNKTISLTALVTDESSVVEAQGPTHNGLGTVTAKGWAKKHPKDDPNEQVGFNVAVARALRALADQYDERAEQAMNTTTYDLTGYVTGPVEFTYGGNDYNGLRNLVLDNVKLNSVRTV